ncbi:hypothetical protein D9M71_343710 [compost metagenome]
MRKHVLNERVLERDHLLEAGRRAHLDGLVEQEDARQQAEEDDDRAIVEDQALEEGSLILVMCIHSVHTDSPAYCCSVGSAPVAEATWMPP